MFDEECSDPFSEFSPTKRDRTVSHGSGHAYDSLHQFSTFDPLSNRPLSHIPVGHAYSQLAPAFAQVVHSQSVPLHTSSTSGVQQGSGHMNGWPQTRSHDPDFNASVVECPPPGGSPTFKSFMSTFLDDNPLPPCYREPLQYHEGAMRQRGMHHSIPTNVASRQRHNSPYELGLQADYRSPLDFRPLSEGGHFNSQLTSSLHAHSLLASQHSGREAFPGSSSVDHQTHSPWHGWHTCPSAMRLPPSDQHNLTLPDEKVATSSLLDCINATNTLPNVPKAPVDLSHVQPEFPDEKVASSSLLDCINATNVHPIGTTAPVDLSRLQPECKPLVRGGATVMVGPETSATRNGRSRHGPSARTSNLNSIIRVSRQDSATARAQLANAPRDQVVQQPIVGSPQDHQPSLYDKVQAAESRQGPTGSGSLGDSRDLGSTLGKRRAVTAMADMDLDASTHSTGSIRRKTQMLNDLSTEDRIKKVIGKSEDSQDIQDMLDWEQQVPPGGKWRGVNARQWGKVGIEVRLTGTSRYASPVTHLGRQVAVFADMVEVEVHVERPSDSSGQSGDADDGLVRIEQNGPNITGAELVNSELLSTALSPGNGADKVLSNGGSDVPKVVAAPTSLLNGPERKYIWRRKCKDKAWLGTFHTPINAAVHHDFFKIVLAVEGKIYTSPDMDTCDKSASRQRPHMLKLNFSLDELPMLMHKSVQFTNIWQSYYQSNERYIFRDTKPEAVEGLVASFIDKHCACLRNFIPAPNETVGPPSSERRVQPRRQPKPRASSLAMNDDTLSL